MDNILSRMADLFSPERLADYLIGTLLPDVIVASLTLLAFVLIWKAAARALNAVLARSSLDKTAQNFAQTVTRYVILTIGAVTALTQLGINTGSLLASLGVAGLTLGFAAKDALSNIISGIFIFWDRPFVMDDLIEVGGHYGRVQEITMRSTRVVTVDGKMLAIPNSHVINSIVASYTNFPHVRLDIDVTVGSGEDLGRIRRLLLELVAAEPFVQDPAPQVVVTAINDYNVAMQLRVWLGDERRHIQVRFELRERVFECLRSAKVDMPLETIQLAPFSVRTSADAPPARDSNP